MKPISIRLKLTAWYVAVLLASLILFAITAFIVMKKGIEKSVDENLEGQAAGVEEVIERVVQAEPARLADELRQHQEIREQADFLQVGDQNGRWIYRSRLMTHYEVPLPVKASGSAYDIMSVDLPMRVLVREMSVGSAIQVDSSVALSFGACPRIRRWILVERTSLDTSGSHYPSSPRH
jgi:hypothetical protein